MAVVTPPSVSRLSVSGGTRVCGPRLAAAAGQVDVPVDQSRNDPPPAQVGLPNTQAHGRAGQFGADPQDPLARHEKIAGGLAAPGRTTRRCGAARSWGTEYTSVQSEAAHRGGEPVGRIGEVPADAEISSVDALSCSAAAAICCAAAA